MGVSRPFARHNGRNNKVSKSKADSKQFRERKDQFDEIAKKRLCSSSMGKGSPQRIDGKGSSGFPKMSTRRQMEKDVFPLPFPKFYFSIH
jgi:hypothetical protein